MKLELKNIKHSAFASEETHCFEAKVYVDGKPVGTVSNEGRGGPDRVHVPNDVHAEIEAHIKTIMKPEVIQGITIEPSFEIWCGEQVNQFLVKRDLNRRLKKKLLFVQDGKLWETPLGTHSVAAVSEHFKKKYGDDCKILNTLPEAERIEAYMQYA